MSLIYRAIWRDDRIDLIEQTAKSFRDWATEKYGNDLLFESEPQTLNGITTALRFAQGDGVHALEGVMVEESPSDRWMTRQRVLVGEDGEQWIWIDIERTTHNVYQRHDIAAPRLVRNLLDEGRHGGGNPRIGEIRLDSRAYAVPAPRVEVDLVRAIRDPHRKVPIVVFTHSNELSPSQTME